MQIPGINIFGGLVILTAIGEIIRVTNAKKVCGYAGLVRSIQRSGQKNSNGPITKAGESRLRWGLLEAGHVSVRHDAQLARFLRRLKERKGATLRWSPPPVRCCSSSDIR